MEPELKRLKETVARYSGHGLTEQDTKNAIIEPILALFGWPKTDLARVRAEYRHTSRDNPVDYALMVNGGPALLVEAKALDKCIDDHKFITQNLAYANAANVGWALLTNGDRWDLYAVFERSTPEKRRVFSIRIHDSDFAEHISWIRSERIVSRELDRYWRRARAARRVTHAFHDLVDRRDPAFVDLLARNAEVPEDDVRAALEVLRPNFVSPTAEPIAVESNVQPTPAPSPEETPQPPNARAPSLISPPRGAKPASLRVGTETRDVSSWREMLIETSNLMHTHHPQRFEQVFDAAEFAGRTRRYFDRSGSAMHSPLRIPGGYVEGNLSGPDIVRLVGKLVDFVGIPREAVNYTLR